MQSPPVKFLPYELEVLDGVGKVDPIPLNSRGLEGRIQEPAGRSHKRMPGKILFVPRFFTHHDQVSARRAFSKYRLGRVPKKIAPAAMLHGAPHTG
jgi:hypothetical protein